MTTHLHTSLGLLFLLGIALPGVAGCEGSGDRPPSQVIEFDHLVVAIHFDEEICSGTGPWIESQLAWLEEVFGVPTIEDSIVFHWYRRGSGGICAHPDGSCTNSEGIFGQLPALTHELVHGFAGPSRLFLSEGLAVALAEDAFYAASPVIEPGELLAATNSNQLDYGSAGLFVDHLIETFGLPLVLELYDSLPEAATEADVREAFDHVLGKSFDAVEAAYLARFEGVAWDEIRPRILGALYCEHKLIPWNDGLWRHEVRMACDAPDMIGPVFYRSSPSPEVWTDVTLWIEEAGYYLLTPKVSGSTGITFETCDGDAYFRPGMFTRRNFYSFHGGRAEELYLEPGLYRVHFDGLAGADIMGRLEIEASVGVHGVPPG